MTPANKTKLEKVSSELARLAKHRDIDAQSLTIELFRILELVQVVLVDLAYRPEVNSPASATPKTTQEQTK